MNSFPNTAIHGCEIYYYRNDKDGEALGKSIMDSLVSNIDLLDRGVKTADLFLLREIGASSLQLEIDYITNPERELKFRDEDFKSSVAKAIANGIGDYYRY